VAACGLAEQGRRVLVVEAGSWPSIAELSTDHIRNPRSDWGVAPRSGPGESGNPRLLRDGRRMLEVRPSDSRYSNNASTAGGGTRVYGAQAWRFVPDDLRMASTYGVPDGSDLADWPFDYDALEPYYARAEWEAGVSGASAEPNAGPRSRPLPMPPLPAGAQRDRLAAAAASLGWSTTPVPLLVNSTPYLGRHACARCSMCVGFACPVDAKNGSQNTFLTRAFATGRCEIVLSTRASRLRTDAAGRVIGVTLVGDDDGAPWSRDVDAAEIVVSAGAIESARLLLNSASDREPNGIGNNADQVGRHLQGHVYGGATALFDDVVEELIGPGPSIATTDFRHGNDGLVGGGMIANEFVPLPANIYRYLVSSRLLADSGIESKRGMRDTARRMLRLMGPIQEVTSAESRVRVDPGVRDSRGVPVAVLSGSAHPLDIAARDLLSQRSAQWLEAAGASRVVAVGERPGGAGQNTGQEQLPSGGQHQAGTLRMGTDPARSVVDPFGRVWGHDNLRIADGSVHVTNGGVNPVLTIFATSLRTIEDMAGGWSSPVA
jgi:choline dehydrogenase-like flavoprotein